MLAFTRRPGAGSGKAGRDRQCRGAGLHGYRADAQADRGSGEKIAGRAALKRLCGVERRRPPVWRSLSDAARHHRHHITVGLREIGLTRMDYFGPEFVTRRYGLLPTCSRSLSQVPSNQTVSI